MKRTLMPYPINYHLHLHESLYDTPYGDASFELTLFFILGK